MLDSDYDDNDSMDAMDVTQVMQESRELTAQKEKYLKLSADEKYEKYGNEFTRVSTIPTWAEYYRKHEERLKQLDIKSHYSVQDSLNKRISLWRGDITELNVEVIVNTCNFNLDDTLGGLDGVVKNKAGQPLLDELSELRGRLQKNKLEAGEAIMTPGYQLPAKYIIHTRGPQSYQENSKELLMNCYTRVMEIVQMYNLQSVAFPCICTGSQGFCLTESADIALSVIRDIIMNNSTIDRVIFCMIDEQSISAYEQMLLLYYPENGTKRDIGTRNGTDNGTGRNIDTMISTDRDFARRSSTGRDIGTRSGTDSATGWDRDTRTVTSVSRDIEIGVDISSEMGRKVDPTAGKSLNHDKGYNEKWRKESKSNENVATDNSTGIKNFFTKVLDSIGSGKNSNDQRRDPPKDPIDHEAMARIEADKDYFLSMTLEEKRKTYKCGDRYVTLKDIPTWGQYYRKNHDNMAKMDTGNDSCCDVLNGRVSLWKGDITRLEVDAVVNAANSSLIRGGGVDDRIHDSAGHKLSRECLSLGGCKTGHAKITAGYRLPAKYVIHAVGPCTKDPELLQSTYQNSLEKLCKQNLQTIAFPCISTGIYGYPQEKAAFMAATTVRKFLCQNQNVQRVIFCVFLPVDLEIYQQILQIVFPVDLKKEILLDPSQPEREIKPNRSRGKDDSQSNHMSSNSYLGQLRDDNSSSWEATASERLLRSKHTPSSSSGDEYRSQRKGNNSEDRGKMTLNDNGEVSSEDDHQAKGYEPERERYGAYATSIDQEGVRGVETGVWGNGPTDWGSNTAEEEGEDFSSSSAHWSGFGRGKRLHKK